MPSSPVRSVSVLVIVYGDSCINSILPFILPSFSPLNAHCFTTPLYRNKRIILKMRDVTQSSWEKIKQLNIYRFCSLLGTAESENVFKATVIQFTLGDRLLQAIKRRAGKNHVSYMARDRDVGTVRPQICMIKYVISYTKWIKSNSMFNVVPEYRRSLFVNNTLMHRYTEVP